MAVRLFKSKKGIFFTMIAIMIITVLFVTFTPASSTTLKHNIPTVNSRITTADDFVETIKTAYVPKALEVSSYNALSALSVFLRERGTLLFTDFDELNRQFTEVMLNGSIECSPGVHEDIETCVCSFSGCDPTTISLMRGRNFTQRLRDIEAASFSALVINTDFTSTYSDFAVKLFQDNTTGPFLVGVDLTINFSVNAGLAWWNDTVNVTTVFHYDGIEDPLYSVKSEPLLGTRYTNIFNETNITNWNISNTWLLAHERTYNRNSDGRSFLGRFTEVDEDSDCCGMESLINPVVMDDSDVPLTETPYTDWCFFGSRCPTDTAFLWKISCISEPASGSEHIGLSFDTTLTQKYGLALPDGEGRVLRYPYEDPDPFSAQCSDMFQSVCNTPGSPHACT